jgi:geranylgeranyl diphosphate synthase type II
MSFFQLPSFQSKKRLIDSALSDLLEKMEEKTELKKAVEYAFFNGGKRVRPIIVLMLQEALNCPYSLIDAALSIELFHTASLIADDLPMMDNDAFRREKPALHIQFGETTALLASYGLIALSFEKIHDCSYNIIKFDPTLSNFSNDACLKALKAASFAAGLKGATLGQYYDLFPNEGCSIKKLIYLKTVTLFEVAFLFGWIFGGGDQKKLDEIKKLAFNFGLAYQIADDLQDYDEDLQKGKIGNYALTFGKDTAKEAFSFHLQGVKKGLQELNLNTLDFKALVSFLEMYGNKKPLLDLKAAFSRH